MIYASRQAEIERGVVYEHEALGARVRRKSTRGGIPYDNGVRRVQYHLPRSQPQRLMELRFRS